MVERWPLIITAGGVVLAVTAAQMVTKESLFADLLDNYAWAPDVFYWTVHGLFVATIVALSWNNSKRAESTESSSTLETV